MNLERKTIATYTLLFVLSEIIRIDLIGSTGVLSVKDSKITLLLLKFKSLS